MTDRVRQDNKVPGGIEQTTLLEQHAGKALAQESRAAAGGAVHDQHCIAGTAIRIAPQCSQRAVVLAQIQGFAMRLHHLGLDATMQGAMNTPPLDPGDLFLTSAGPGELSTVTALMQTARNAGAQTLFLAATPDTPSDALATHVLHIPAQTMATDTKEPTSTLPMGSLYEGALFVLFEVMVQRLAEILGETPDTMRARHTNME